MARDRGERKLPCIPARWRRALAIAVSVVAVVTLHIVWQRNVYSLKSLLARSAQSGRRLLGDHAVLAREADMLAYHEWQARQYPPPVHNATQCAALLSRLRAPGVSADKHQRIASSIADMAARGTVAWVTALATDGYLLPVLALATALDRFSCVRRRLVLIPPDFPRASEDLLRRMGFESRRVDKDYVIKCVNAERFRGAFLRLHAFDMTEFERLVYVDSDFLPLSNIDEVFAAVSDVHDVAAAEFERPFTWDLLPTVLKDNGFNSGLLVFTPHLGLKDAVLEEMQDRCIGESDQPLLHHVFLKLNMPLNLLPFAYNVRKTAYHPMRTFHFAGPPEMKVWRSVVPPDEAEDRPIRAVPQDIAVVFWHYVYMGQRLFGVKLA